MLIILIIFKVILYTFEKVGVVFAVSFIRIKTKYPDQCHKMCERAQSEYSL